MQQRAPVCEVCGCSFCPEGFEVGNLGGLIEIPSNDSLPPKVSEVPCTLLDYAGSSGQISETECNDDFRLFPEFREVCGCPPLPAVSKDDAKTADSVRSTEDGQFGTDGDGEPIRGGGEGDGEKMEKGGERGEKEEKGKPKFGHTVVPYCHFFAAQRIQFCR